MFAKAFEENYVNVATKWEELSDKDLMLWIDRLEHEFSDVPFCEYNVDAIEDVEYD